MHCMKRLSLYIHFPYCLSKCPYCDFFSVVGQKQNDDILIKAYQRDLKIFSDTKTPLDSVFFGGGTPSLMSEKLFISIFDEIQKSYLLSDTTEISLEANPDAIDKQKMIFFKSNGVNRLSMGVQALCDKDLKTLGRHHDLKTALDRIDDMKDVFSNSSIDLIYGRPEQKLSDWEKEIQTALSFDLPHYSMYQLTIEAETPFGKNNVPEVSDLSGRAFWLLTKQAMTSAGADMYEISNFAKKDMQCRHNLNYWTYQNYIGIGPAAHGRIDGIATENPRHIDLWIKNKPLTEKLSSSEQHEERVMMGLRLTQGIPDDNISPKAIQKAIQNGWITYQDKIIQPTEEGLLMLNQLTVLLM